MTTWYLATCQGCTPILSMPFTDLEERNTWVAAHEKGTDHFVHLGIDTRPPALGGEVRITDPVTGGQKGQKAAQLGALDPEALLTVARIAGFGAQKYDRFNFVRGYDWSLSFDALQRHLMQWAAGEDIDDESGESHLGHAAWHCLALLTFTQRGRGTDDRIIRFLEGLDTVAPPD